MLSLCGATLYHSPGGRHRIVCIGSDTYPGTAKRPMSHSSTVSLCCTLALKVPISLLSPASCSSAPGNEPVSHNTYMPHNPLSGIISSCLIPILTTFCTGPCLQSNLPLANLYKTVIKQQHRHMHPTGPCMQHWGRFRFAVSRANAIPPRPSHQLYTIHATIAGSSTLEGFPRLSSAPFYCSHSSFLLLTCHSPNRGRPETYTSCRDIPRPLPPLPSMS